MFLLECMYTIIWMYVIPKDRWHIISGTFIQHAINLNCLTAFTQGPDSRVGPGRWVRSVLRGVSLTRVYTVIPLTEQTPQVGQIERAQVRNFSCYTWEKFHTLQGQTKLSVYTHTKSGVRPRMRGRTLQICWSTKGGSDPAIGAGDLSLHWGAKGGVWPRIWASTRQLENCVNTVSVFLTWVFEKQIYHHPTPKIIIKKKKLQWYKVYSIIHVDLDNVCTICTLYIVH